MLKPCTAFGCRELGTLRGRCPEHARVLERDRGSAWRRGYDTAWQRTRADVLAREPRCARCGRPSLDVHHIVPRRAGGQNIATNLVALCHACHSSITARGWRQ